MQGKDSEMAQKKADPKSQKPMRVAIAAGGTGGHIMPALALAKTLNTARFPLTVDFLCGNRPVEKRIYQAAGMYPRVFPVGSIQHKSLFVRAWRYLILFWSFLISLLQIGKYDVVVGMGGYVTLPVIFAAWVRRVPIVLHEQNTVLGKVNRLLAKKSWKVACGMPLHQPPTNGTANHYVQTGTPVRPAIHKGNKQEAVQAMYLQEECFTLLINGGSLGSKALNTLMVRTLGCLSGIWPEDRCLQVIWSTGQPHFETVRAALNEEHLKCQIYVAPHIDRMDLAYSLTDLVISRAGGSTLAELEACGLPALLFPLPSAADKHQFYNAKVLEEKGAALTYDEREITPEKLAQKIVSLGASPVHLSAMSQAAKRLSNPEASKDLARLVVKAARSRQKQQTGHAMQQPAKVL